MLFPTLHLQSGHGHARDGGNTTFRARPASSSGVVVYRVVVGVGVVGVVVGVPLGPGARA